VNKYLHTVASGWIFINIKYVDLSAGKNTNSGSFAVFRFLLKKYAQNVRMRPTQEQPLLGLKGRRA